MNTEPIALAIVGIGLMFFTAVTEPISVLASLVNVLLIIMGICALIEVFRS